jgi:hypothetical protein
MGIFILAWFNFIKCVVISMALFVSIVLSVAKNDTASVILFVGLILLYWWYSFLWLKETRKSIKKMLK